MRIRQRAFELTAIGILILAIYPGVLAQDKKSSPNHVHYKEPAQQAVSPTGAILLTMK